MRSVCTLFLSLCCANLFSQKICKGILLDSTSGKPIEFANIGIVGKGFGTVTNEQGEFNFAVPDSVANAPVKVSMIGYRSKTFSLATLTSLTKITLAQTATNLNEVAVSAKKTKIKVLGNDTKTDHVTAGFVKNTLGAELAIKLNIKHPQTHLKKFYLNIARNSIEKPIFRFNVYNKDAKGNPKDNILTQNIIIETKEKTGLIELDLTPYNLFVDDDVFISLEWIKDLGDVKGLFFSAKLVGSPTYYRQASQDKWQKIPVGIGLHAEVAY
ncbi:MAG: carboxypeptidase-like regulatory domain-containing protein [Bacteroidetes bacterium]|nr:carboxypeptidase-like regulatory domain-containing protein [Bacteroidota bacterium]